MTCAQARNDPPRQSAYRDSGTGEAPVASGVVRREAFKQREERDNRRDREQRFNQRRPSSRGCRVRGANGDADGVCYRHARPFAPAAGEVQPLRRADMSSRGTARSRQHKKARVPTVAARCCYKLLQRRPRFCAPAADRATVATTLCVVKASKAMFTLAISADAASMRDAARFAHRRASICRR